MRHRLAVDRDNIFPRYNNQKRESESDKMKATPPDKITELQHAIFSNRRKYRVNVTLNKGWLKFWSSAAKHFETFKAKTL